MKGRKRQAERLRRLSKHFARSVTDFVAPTQEIRDLFKADILIWMDTVKESKYEDTDKIFEPPTNFDYRITTKDARHWAKLITKEIL
jgi:adenylylsulfate kinase